MALRDDEGLLDALVARSDAHRVALSELPDGSWGELLDAPPLEESDGIEELRQLAEAIAVGLHVDKVWAGRADAVRVRTACPACSRRQVVGIPFLQHSCESCGSAWEPRRCKTCARTRVCTKPGASPLFADHAAPTCRCGGELETVRLIPLQRTTVDELAGVGGHAGSGERLEAVAARRTKKSFIGAAAAVAGLAIGGVLLVLPGEGSEAAAAPAAPSASPAAPGTPAALGAAARHQLTLSGRAATTISCQASYDATHRAAPNRGTGPGTVDAAFLRACVGS